MPGDRGFLTMQGKGHRHRMLSVAMALMFLAVAMRWPFLGDPVPDFDEQFYFLVGSRLLSGDLPYVDLWDRKPFLLFVINALGALVSRGSPVGVQVMAMASAGLGALQVWLIARKLGSGAAGLVAAVLFLIAFPVFWAPVAQSEVFYIPLLLGMLQLVILIFGAATPGQALKAAKWSMLLGGLALQVKYTSLPHCALAGVAVLARLRWLGMDWRRLAVCALVFVAIGLGPTLAVAVLYFATGHFEAFWYANFVSIFSRGGLEGDVARLHLVNIVFSGGPLVAFALAGTLKLRTLDPRAQLAFACVCGFTFASLGSLLMMGMVYSHYFLPLVPGLVLMAVPFFASSAISLAIGVAGIGLFAAMADFPAQIERAREDRIGTERMLSLVVPAIDARHCLYVFDGPAMLYVLSDSCLPTSHVYPDHLNNQQESRSIGIDPVVEMRRILSGAPGAIVVSEGQVIPQQNQQTWRLVHDEIERHYRLAGSAVAMKRRSLVYVRRGSRPAS